jgi:UDP-3-O-[3-hydroxymyristoyl] glucosamine N-acyltransferase
MGFTLTEIADAVGGEIIGDRNKVIHRPAPFEIAGQDEITFAGSSKYIKDLVTSKAGAVIVPSSTKEAPVNLIAVENPQVAFAKAIELFYPRKATAVGISPTAIIGRNFRCGDSISVNHGVFIADNVTMGSRVTLHPGVVIAQGVTIGDEVEICPNVTILERCIIGDRVVVHAGTVIGSDGFGFAPDKEKYVKIPHAGIVRIDDDCEIGAGNTIDRGTLGETWIKRGVKTDNLVHIAHNVTIGEDTILVAQVGIAGSATIGDHVVLAGQVGVSGHLTIGNNAIIGPQSGIAKPVPDGSVVMGTPGMPHKLWLRVQRLIPKIPELAKKISQLEKEGKK